MQFHYFKTVFAHPVSAVFMYEKCIYRINKCTIDIIMFKIGNDTFYTQFLILEFIQEWLDALKIKIEEQNFYLFRFLKKKRYLLMIFSMQDIAKLTRAKLYFHFSFGNIFSSAML